MSESITTTNRAECKPLPENIRSVQPGSGKCYRIELAWGRIRRWWLKTFRPGYVRKMADLRNGSTEGAPHEILDPRDLKFCRNVVNCSWDEKDDRFRWRQRIPFARWGLAELQLMGYPMLAATIAVAILAPGPYRFLAAIPGILFFLVAYFFRDPNRNIPTDNDILVSPADGTVAEVTELEHDEFIGGPSVRIGIFLSIFNVHINRSPCDAKVIELQYSPGEFLNALNPESAIRNENMWIGLEQESAPHRLMVVRQISGLIARRIVCDLKPGDVLPAGFKFGMIKLGSRTELILPLEDGLKIEVSVGQKIKAGSTIMVRFKNQDS